MKSTKAQMYKARVSDSYYLNDSKSYLLMKLELVEPELIEFEAGQYVSIKVNESGERRSYSIVSTPDVNHGTELCIEIIPGGAGSEYLKNLKPGDGIELLGPMGRFVVEPEILEKHEEGKKLLFVATGSGIAPIASIINDLLINKKVTIPMRLHWGMRDEESMFWFDNFQRLAEEHNNFVFDQVLSKPSENWELCVGHVQDCIGRDFAKEDIKKWEVFACGGVKMMDDLRELFAKMGTPEQQFHSEKFS